MPKEIASKSSEIPRKKNNEKSFWKPVIQSALGGILAGLVMLFAAGRWADNKIEELKVQIRGGGNQVSAIKGNVGQVNQTSKKVSLAQDVKGDKNQAVQGNNNNLNMTVKTGTYELTLDQVKIVDGQVEVGKGMILRLNNCTTLTEKDLGDFDTKINNWVIQTTDILKGMNERASFNFKNTVINPTGLETMGCISGVFQRVNIIQNYLSSLREITK